MPLVHADFVEETTTTTGTGTLSLSGATAGNRTFVAGIGTGNTCVYAIKSSDGQFESGIGTVTDGSPDTLSRDTLFASSTGSKIDLPSGTHTVFCSFSGDGASKAYSAVQSDPTGITGADVVTNIISLTQAEYDAIGSPSASTLYIITDA
jgi:hypothetical protein